MGSRFDPSDRHNDDLIDAVERAAEHIGHTLREGFKLLALHIVAAQGASPDNTQAIEAQVGILNALTAKLKKSAT